MNIYIYILYTHMHTHTHIGVYPSTLGTATSPSTHAIQLGRKQANIILKSKTIIQQMC